MPSIHYRIPRHLKNSRLHVNMLYLLEYSVLTMKNQGQRSQEQIPMAKIDDAFYK